MVVFVSAVVISLINYSSKQWGKQPRTNLFYRSDIGIPLQRPAGLA